MSCEILYRLESIMERERVLIDAVADAESVLTKITPALKCDRIQTSPTNTFEDAVVRHLEAQERLKKFREHNSSAIMRACFIFDSMPNETHALILWYRFHDGWTFERMAQKMGKSLSYVYTHYGQALQEFKQVSKTLAKKNRK